MSLDDFDNSTTTDNRENQTDQRSSRVDDVLAFDNSMPPEYRDKQAKHQSSIVDDGIDLDDEDIELKPNSRSSKAQYSDVNQKDNSISKPWLTVTVLIAFIAFIVYKFVYVPHVDSRPQLSDALKVKDSVSDAEIAAISPPAQIIQKPELNSPKLISAELSKPESVAKDSGDETHLQELVESIRKNQEIQLEILKELKEASANLEIKLQQHDDFLHKLAERSNQRASSGNTTLSASSKPNIQSSQNKSARRNLEKPIDPIPTKPPVVFPEIRIASIKNYNGKSGANLFLRGQASPFILVGQYWNGITLVGADATSRSVSIEYSNEIRTFRL